MSAVFFRTVDGEIINAAYVVTIYPNGLAELSGRRSVKLLMENLHKSSRPITVEFGLPYSYEEQFTWLSSGLSQIADALKGKK